MYQFFLGTRDYPDSFDDVRDPRKWSPPLEKVGFDQPLWVHDESHPILPYILMCELEMSGSFCLFEHHDENMIQTTLREMPHWGLVTFSFFFFFSQYQLDGGIHSYAIRFIVKYVNPTRESSRNGPFSLPCEETIKRERQLSVFSMFPFSFSFLILNIESLVSYF